MTQEERKVRIKELTETMMTARHELRKLNHEETLSAQQEALKWVGRAFKTWNRAVLIKSVPPIQMNMVGEDFNKYQYPCISVKLNDKSSPVFEDRVYVNERPFASPIDKDVECEEIPVSEFRNILETRVKEILLMAIGAKERQAGREIVTFDGDEICEK